MFLKNGEFSVRRTFKCSASIMLTLRGWVKYKK